MPNKSQEKDKKENTSLAAKGALAHRLQRRTAFKIQNGRQGAGTGKKRKRLTEIVVTTSLPAVDRPNADPGTPHARAYNGVNTA